MCLTSTVTSIGDSAFSSSSLSWISISTYERDGSATAIGPCNVVCVKPFQVCGGRVRVRLRWHSPGGSGGAQQRDLTRGGRELDVLLYEHLFVVEPNILSSQPTSLFNRVTFTLKMTTFK